MILHMSFFSHGDGAEVEARLQQVKEWTERKVKKGILCSVFFQKCVYYNEEREPVAGGS